MHIEIVRKCTLCNFEISCSDELVPRKKSLGFVSDIMLFLPVSVAVNRIDCFTKSYVIIFYIVDKKIIFTVGL